MYKALNLSKYIVSKCVKEDCPISNLQLQKILYYIQRKFLQEYDYTAFHDEIEAWQFGPVVPNVYYEYCGYGATHIREMHEHSIEVKEHLDIINSLVEEKRSMYPWQLVDETHEPGCAWDLTYANGSGNHKVIPVELIKRKG